MLTFKVLSFLFMLPTFTPLWHWHGEKTCS